MSECKDCIYYIAGSHDEDDKEYGNCHRNAPMPITINEDCDDVGVLPTEWECAASFTRWPYVRAVDWCGEFKPKDVESK